MSGSSPDTPSIDQVEDVMRFELSRGDALLASARPVLAHLLNSGDHLQFSDEIIARVRGMASHAARQLLDAVGEADDRLDRDDLLASNREALTETILADSGFLSHAHALALEVQWADTLHQRCGLDPVLTPFLQELAASTDSEIAGAAMHVLAAQARFVQQQRRMELTLGELPGGLFHRVLLAMRSCADVPEGAGQQAEARLRRAFDEGGSRAGQMARLLLALGHRAERALAIDHAGLALFVSALAMASGQSRDLATHALGENQLARFALALRAAGLPQGAVEAQFLLLHPEITLPPGFDGLSVERAAALLASGQVQGED
ncbi:hypothetical protein [Aurantiacibacter suaedae]|uniref:hypothetical protein n=1 Tax=Aurantiacibacter suaedae TaxID=2545755 RepID=UPI0010F93F30|nr:hypothetical protein [Aurantiacibacter suaedae]